MKLTALFFLSSIVILALVAGACAGDEAEAPEPAAQTAPTAVAPAPISAPATQPTVAAQQAPASTAVPAPAAAAAVMTEQSGTLVWCCQLGHPNDVPSYVPFFSAVSDHYGSKEPLLWRERAPIPQIGALNMSRSLAESWEVSPDQTSITFKIRQGSHFTRDGET